MSAGGRTRRGRPPAQDASQQHRDWLALVEVTGPFLSLPVLRQAWPAGPDGLSKDTREELRRQHALWVDDRASGQRAWLEYVLGELLGWGDTTCWTGLDALAVDVPEHDTRVEPSFALVDPDAAADTAEAEADDAEVKPDAVRLLGLVCPAGAAPTARVRGDAWAATPVDRLAHACRHHGVELGLATDGRWWSLVWAPRGGVTTTATFDAVSWPEAAEREVVRAFVSLLCRRRFFGVPEEQRLPALFSASLDSQEDITEALGVNVRRAVELLVAALGRADVHDRERGGSGLGDVDAHEVYRGAVAVMMRIVFLLFAEERGLLPADNALYATAYSAGGLADQLKQRAAEGSEVDLEHTTTAWHRLLALFSAVYRGVAHPRMEMHAHDGSIFDPDAYPWLPTTIDDRTVLHMLDAVQYVQVGSGRSRERRRTSFRTLDVEQIGYVYEGLLSYEGFRATDTVVGLVGKPGLEEEVSLADVERHVAAVGGDVGALAAGLADAYKDSGIGSLRRLEQRLAPPGDADRVEAERTLLAVTGGDLALTRRVLPYIGIIRTDLRDLPVVILPGALYVTESKLRRNTGTHYTPRFLAEQVVEGALEPLVYAPGPLQTASREEWKLRPAAEILSLKVADIAMGSGAFLVAACRYLADRLVEAWSAEGDERAVAYVSRVSGSGVGPATDADEDPLVVEARRQVIEHCLYGVDINPMAVEMAKLSLWLVSMDPHRPFTFLDDRLVAGDSLLGITSLDQLEVMHLDAAAGRRIHERALLDFTAGVRSLLAEVADERRALAEIKGDDLDGLAEKRRLLAHAEAQTERASLFADLTVGAALANAGKGDARLRDGSIAAADRARRVDGGSPNAEAEARGVARKWLATDLVRGAFPRQPLHWPLVFPEVFERGSFDAIIGNPPFLGGKKVSGATGSAYREHLVEALAGGVKGNADLIAFFVLRAHTLINTAGQTGLIATNTLAQGDTREVGLDQLAVRGVTIRQAVKSEKWPSKSAVLEYCAVWSSRGELDQNAERIADGVAVQAITPSLDPASRMIGNPYKLVANSRKVFQGSNIVGIGFVLEPEEALKLIGKNTRNAEVLFPFLNGQDLNSRSDYSASRWVINFHNWSRERAAEYPDVMAIARERVKPQRDRLPDYKRRVRENWWKYEHQATPLYDAISELERVIALTRVSKTVMPVMVPTGQVVSEAVVVFATDNTAMLALLSSAPHYWWARARASSMKTDLRYTPSDVFETFPLPELTEEMREFGDRLDTYRRELMLRRNAGLTATYNLVHDPACADDDIVELRRIHRDTDATVVRAYGWHDLLEPASPYGGLDHGHHPVARETRYTIGPAVRQEILDRLLELNHARYAEEAAARLHPKTKTPRRTTDDALF